MATSTAATAGDPIAAASHHDDVDVMVTIEREQTLGNLARQRSSGDEQQVWAAASLQAPHLHTLLPLEDGPDGPAAYQHALSLR